MPMEWGTVNTGKNEQKERHVQLLREWKILLTLWETQKNPDPGKPVPPPTMTYELLAKAMGVDPQTIRRDIDTLKKAGFKITKKTVKRRAYLMLESMPMTPISFNRNEMLALLLARDAVTSFVDTPFQKGMDTATDKIRKMAQSEAGETAVDFSRFMLINKRARRYGSRSVWLTTIINAIRSRNTIKIRYYTNERDVTLTREVDPYGLIIHEGAIFIIGYCHLKQLRRTFLLERIHYVNETGKKFDYPIDFNLRKHFDNAYEIISGKALHNVIIRFSRRAGKVVEEGKWHPSQKVAKQADGSYTISMKLDSLIEINRWVLSFGSEAEVVSPPELKEMVADEARKMASHYNRRGK